MESRIAPEIEPDILDNRFTELLGNLRDSFTTAEAVREALQLGISESSVKRFLRDGGRGFVKKKSHGCYRKIWPMRWHYELLTLWHFRPRSNWLRYPGCSRLIWSINLALQDMPIVSTTAIPPPPRWGSIPLETRSLLSNDTLSVNDDRLKNEWWKTENMRLIDYSISHLSWTVILRFIGHRHIG